jgi:hypothetical protein
MTIKEVETALVQHPDITAYVFGSVAGGRLPVARLAL